MTLQGRPGLKFKNLADENSLVNHLYLLSACTLLPARGQLPRGVCFLMNCNISNSASFSEIWEFFTSWVNPDCNTRSQLTTESLKKVRNFAKFAQL